MLERAAGAPGIRDTQERLRLVVEAPHAWLLIHERDGEITGSVIAAWDGWRGTIYRLAVAPEHRRGTVGTALVRAAEERLRSAGARRIGLLVFRDNDGGQSFWRAAGYEEDARVVRFVKNIADD